MTSLEKTAVFPRILNIAALLWFLYMIGCATIRGLLVFYAADQLKMTEGMSVLIYAAYGAINSVISFAGGWAAVKFFGFKATTKIGLFFYGIGIILLAITFKPFLYFGLSCMAVGSGFFSPNINSLLSRALKSHSFKRNSAFTICYTSMNTGAFFGYCMAGILKGAIGYTFTFLFAGAIVFLGFIIFQLYKQSSQEDNKFFYVHKLMGIIFVLVLLSLIDLLLNFASTCDYLVVIFGIITIVILTAIGFKKWIKNQDSAWFKYTGLGFISILFWSLYQLKASFLNFYIKDFVNRIYLGVAIPATFFQALNPIFMIFLGFFLAAFWIWIDRKKIIFNLANKFCLAVFFMGLAYILLAVGGNFTAAQEVNIIWIILFFLFMSLGEMIIAPTGYAMIGELFSQPKTQGILQGLWDVFGAIGYAFSGVVATKMPILLGIKDTVLTLRDDDKIFTFIGYFVCVSAIALTLLTQRWYKKYI